MINNRVVADWASMKQLFGSINLNNSTSSFFTVEIKYGEFVVYILTMVAISSSHETVYQGHLNYSCEVVFRKPRCSTL